MKIKCKSMKMKDNKQLLTKFVNNYVKNYLNIIVCFYIINSNLMLVKKININLFKYLIIKCKIVKKD